MEESSTPVSSWLAFTLAFESSARLIGELRDSGFDVQKIGAMIDQFVNAEGREANRESLENALRGKLQANELKAIHSTANQRKIDQALQWQSKSDQHHLIGIDHPDYPSQLLSMADSPALLYAKGNLSVLKQAAVAIVGSRKASHASIQHSKSLAAALADQGLAIISGLALGIDAAAHEGALQALGKTIAVAATEIDTVYPKRHESLAQRIIDGNGLILTEYPLGAKTRRWYFPRRNRIISGLSHGVIVAEAGLPSGSLTTATHAMNQGREVMAIPGAVSNPNVRGCHALIKQGAALVEHADDVLDVLGSAIVDQLEPVSRSTDASDALSKFSRSGLHNQQSLDIAVDDTSPLMELVLRQLAAGPASTDELAHRLKQGNCGEMAQLSATLGLLEVYGKITTTAGGRYSRC
ncbi:MAG: DNA-processing protein DprA [Granulosicoccus sp.]|nr:DNA-processing protein DprA [Granulosicoccus sp.]